MNILRLESIERNKRLVPDKELYNRSGYYVVDDIVVKANGVPPEDLTPLDIIHFTKPEYRMVIQKGNHLECHFPGHEHEGAKHLLDKISEHTGFTYTLYSCIVTPKTDISPLADSFKNIPSVVLSYESYYYALNGKVVKAYNSDASKLKPEDIVALRSPGELAIIQEDKSLKIYASKKDIPRLERRLEKSKLLGFTYEVILDKED